MARAFTYPFIYYTQRNFWSKRRQRIRELKNVVFLYIIGGGMVQKRL